jgi:aryl-alcohol dehydrogenase-like predicted oxidoreductase
VTAARRRDHHLRHRVSTRAYHGRDRAGQALKGQRRRSIESSPRCFGPTGPKSFTNVGLSRKHILESIDGSLQRLQTDYVDLYQAHRFDYRDPLEGDLSGPSPMSFWGGEGALHRRE